MIRERFLNMLAFLHQEAEAQSYKPGWVWYQLQNCFDCFYQEEIEALQQILGYKPGWVFFQVRNLVGEGRLLEDCRYQEPAVSPLVWACQILSITPPITREKVKRAYRALAKLAHPDAGGEPEQFRQLQQAYEALMGVAHG